MGDFYGALRIEPEFASILASLIAIIAIQRLNIFGWYKIGSISEVA